MCVSVVSLCAGVWWASDPRGSRSESPQSSIWRLLWLWKETVPAPHSFIGNVQTDSRLMLSGTFTEASSIFDSESHVGKWDQEWSHRFEFVAKERMGKADHLCIRDRWILWHAHVPYEHDLSMQKRFLGLSNKGDTEITVHINQTVGAQGSEQLSVHAEICNFRV